MGLIPSRPNHNKDKKTRRVINGVKTNPGKSSHQEEKSTIAKISCDMRGQDITEEDMKEMKTTIQVNSCRDIKNLTSCGGDDEGQGQ